MARIPEKLRSLVRKEFNAHQKHGFIPGKTKIPLTVPTYDSTEIDEALDSLLSTWVTMGKKVKRFEEMFAEYLGCKYAVMVNSGSSANLLALSVLSNPLLSSNIQPGSEIITPAVTWATTIYPIANVGCTPVIVDVNLDTYNIDPEQVKTALSERTRAIMPVHLLGNPCSIDSIQEIAKDKNLFLIEDACESTGAEFNAQKVGTFGDMGTFSFYISHHISTIEGGMIVTDNEDYFEYLKAMRAFGWVRDLNQKKTVEGASPDIDPRFLFYTYGYNFRPTEIQGGFGIHQIRKLDRFIRMRRKNAEYWNRKLRPFNDQLFLPKEAANTRHVYFGYPITVKPNASFERHDLVSRLESKGIETRPIMAGNMTEQPVMKQLKHRVVGNLENSRTVMRRSFFFGNHNGIRSEEREFIADVIVEFLNSASKR